MHPYREAQRLITLECSAYDVSLEWGWGSRHPFVIIRAFCDEARLTYPFNGSDHRAMRNLRSQLRRLLRTIKAEPRVRVKPMEHEPMSKAYDAALVFSTDMEAAPKDEALLMLVPADAGDSPISFELGWWTSADESGSGVARFEGEWRFAEVPHAANDPIAWAKLPVLHPELEAMAREVANKVAD